MLRCYSREIGEGYPLGIVEEVHRSIHWKTGLEFWSHSEKTVCN